jgi:hypothetical protein
VGPGVVGHQLRDAFDAVGGEVLERAGQEPSAGEALLVGQDLGVGQPGVVFDQRVDEVVADPGLVQPGTMVDGRLPLRALTTALGDAAELLDVHVNQVAGPFAFVGAPRLSWKRAPARR